MSFRGKDRDTEIFVSQFRACLSRKGIDVFVTPDNCELSLKAIKASKISVIVFSENFGDSKWCLDEVLAILKCKERYGQIVIPVFYHVDPLDIENQTGRFGDSFGKLATAERFQEWKDGLRQACKIHGWMAGIMRDDDKMLVNIIARDIQNNLSSLILRASRTKVIIEWSLVITNLMLEIASSVVDQIFSTHKPSYVLAAMLLSLLASLISLIDFVHKGIAERVVWKTRSIPWFYYGTRRSKRFGSFADMIGLLCGLCQTIITAINYSFITREVDAQIKFSVWSIIFALGVLYSVYVKKDKTT